MPFPSVLALASLLLAGLLGCSDQPRTSLLAPYESKTARAESATAALPSGPKASKAKGAPPRKPVATSRGAVGTAAVRSAATSPAGPRRESLGLVGDELSGAFARLAADLHDGLDRSRIHVTLTESGGPMRTIDRLMGRHGADVGLIQADALERVSAGHPSDDPKRHLRFVTRLHDKAVHLIARQSIKSIHQLEGLKVDVGPSEGGSSLTARLLFDRLGMSASLSHSNPKEALDRLVSGEVDAVLIVAPTPAWEVLQFQAEGFHLVAIPWEPAIGGVYSRHELHSADYPMLAGEGERVESLAVGVVLAVYNWGKDTSEYRQLDRFVDILLARAGADGRPGDHFAWNGIDLAGEVPGWERFETKGMLRRLRQRT